MAKNFVLQLASLITLVVSIPAFIVMLFGVITLALPDAADSYWQMESARDSIRFSIATLVIFFPAYLILTRLVNKARRNEGTIYHVLTKWLIYLALLVGGLVMLGDLAVTVYFFLEGDVTLRFILKALSILVVVGSAFWYYALDAGGYWQDKEKQSVQIGLIALLVVVVAIVYAYTHIETPQEVRDMKIDEEQITDLSQMQQRIEAHYRTNEALPESLTEVYELEVPEAPEGRSSYKYNLTSEASYELCAEFRQPSTEEERYPMKPIMADDLFVGSENWEHSVGEKCFERKAVNTDG